jgi:hypothetical protein
MCRGPASQAPGCSECKWKARVWRLDSDPVGGGGVGDWKECGWSESGTRNQSVSINRTHVVLRLRSNRLCGFLVVSSMIKDYNEELRERRTCSKECDGIEAAVVNSNTCCALSIVGLALFSNTTILFLGCTTMLRTRRYGAVLSVVNVWHSRIFPFQRAV